jgi:endoglucanase
LHLDVRLVAQRFKLSPADAWVRDLKWADQILDECKKYGITGILSMVQIPVDPALGLTQESPEFWGNSERLKEAVEVAAMLAKHFKGRGAELGAYTILSEPVVRQGALVKRPDAWPALMMDIVKNIRKIDSKRFITISPGPGGLAAGYKDFKPVDDPYIIYDAHIYTPYQYTHQGIFGNPHGISYPGTVSFSFWDKQHLEAAMSPLIEFQKKYDVPVFIGEFSAVRWAPGADDYLKDLITIFDKKGWGWVYFQYKSWHGWDPDFDALYSTNDDAQKHYVGKDTARWKLLKDAYAKNKERGADGK